MRWPLARWDNWQPQPGTVNRIDVSAHRPGTAWLAVYRHRLPGDHPTRVVRADPEREGLLYAGTEFGLFTSFDAGAD